MNEIFSEFFIYSALPYISIAVGLLTAIYGYTNKKIFHYKWQGTEFTEILSKDVELEEILVNHEAPPIEISGNHIVYINNTLPDKEIVCCITRIAEYMHKFFLF